MSLTTGSMVGIAIGAIGCILILYYIIAMFHRTFTPTSEDIRAARKNTMSAINDLGSGGGAVPVAHDLNEWRNEVHVATENACLTTRDLEADIGPASSIHGSH